MTLLLLVVESCFGYGCALYGLVFVDSCLVMVEPCVAWFLLTLALVMVELCVAWFLLNLDQVKHGV